MTAPATSTQDRFEAAAEILALSENFRVLRRFVPDPVAYLGDRFAAPPGCKTALFVDVETDGLDVKQDRVIELSIVPFVFDPDGIVYDAGKALSFLQDPKRALPPEIVALTGITDEMVKGQSIDLDQVRPLVDEAALIIAHHAAFDRPMLERAVPLFRDKAWACSHVEVPWEKEFGCRVAKLPIILSDACGQFSDEHHRATEDCHIGVNVLANARAGGRTALSYLLESARLPSFRLWAEKSPFQNKDKLKARGYWWNDGVKTWYKDLREADVDEETMFARDVAGATPRVEKLTAKTRYR